MTARRAAAYGSPISAIRRRAAALILSCDIVPLFRWPRPGAWPPQRVITMEGEIRTPREGCAALVLKRYRQRRAGLARIRQTWLPQPLYASRNTQPWRSTSMDRASSQDRRAPCEPDRSVHALPVSHLGRGQAAAGRVIPAQRARSRSRRPGLSSLPRRNGLPGLGRLPGPGGRGRGAGLVPPVLAPDKDQTGSGDRDPADEHEQAHRVVVAGGDLADAVRARAHPDDEYRTGEEVQTTNWRNFISSAPDTIDGVTKTAARPHFWYTSSPLATAFFRHSRAGPGCSRSSRPHR